MGNLYLGLVHHPIKNKNNELVTTSVTNLDIHDISRSCRTFGVAKYFIITPLEAQWELVGRILGHWEEDKASAYNPDRQDALQIAKLSKSIEDSIKSIEQLEGKRPKLIYTGANFEGDYVKCSEIKNALERENGPYFIIFGTGWGLHDNAMVHEHLKLEPIFGSAQDKYNHLSVRSAVAIYLDRLTIKINN